MIVAILGIGEAGGALARDLISAGVEVRGWDPNPRELPHGLVFSENNPAAAANVDVVLSVNWASVAVEVAREVAPVLTPRQLYADLNTASPQDKREIATVIENIGARFVDAALMAPVTPKGLGTAVYASGSGAEIFFEQMSPLGMPITVLGEQAGSAATHKLLRSIMYKGVAAVVVECLQAAKKLDLENYARQQMMTILKDEAMIDRFVQGSNKHASRRVHEMEAVVDMLADIGVSAVISQASAAKLKELRS